MVREVDWACFHRRWLLWAWGRQRECGAIPSMRVLERELDKHQVEGCSRCFMRSWSGFEEWLMRVMNRAWLHGARYHGGRFVALQGVPRGDMPAILAECIREFGPIPEYTPDTAFCAATKPQKETEDG